MGSKKTVAVTFNHRSPCLTSKVYPERTNPYGPVLGKIVRGLDQAGWRVDTSLQPASAYRSSESVKQAAFSMPGIVHRLAQTEPDLVIHDPFTFYHQAFFEGQTAFPRTDADTLHSQVAQLRKRIHRAVFDKFRGRAERVYSTAQASGWDAEISSKDNFASIAENIGVPTPKTIVLKKISRKRRTYHKLARELTESSRSPIMVKKVSSSGGKGVTLVKSQEDINRHKKEADPGLNDSVAQEKLPLPNDRPYSIRVVTWGERVLGAALLINLTHDYCSNSHLGGAVSLDLAISGQENRTGTPQLKELDEKVLREVEEICDWCDIDITQRRLPEEIEYHAGVIGLFGANVLLRGNDFMYKGYRESPLAIESNMHPGPPGTGMFASLSGRAEYTRESEIEIASQMILEAIVNN